jgi:hypothetical protein
MFFDIMVLTVLYAIFFEYIRKIFLNIPLDSTTVLISTLLFAIWLSLTRTISNFIATENASMGSPSPWI